MKYRFLIYISHSYAIPIGLPLEKEILNRNYQVRWFIDIEENKGAFENKNLLLENVEDLLNYDPHIILAATNIVPDFLKGLKVQIFHGFNAQKRPENNSFSHFRIRGFFDLYCTQGPSTTKVFKELSKKYKHFDVVETGWSKVDGLFPIKQIDMNKQPANIMIASTFTERLSLAYRDDVYQEIQRLSQEGRFNFLMVLHPKLPEHIKDKWKSLNSEYFKYYDTTKLNPIIQNSQVLFSDTTSVIQEFALQKKPIVVLNHTFKHSYLIHVNKSKEIEKALIYGLSYPRELLKEIENFRESLHPYFDGNSSKRIIDATISFLHKDKNYLKTKPLNLIRKFKIRKKLKYFTLTSYNNAYRL